MKHLTLSLSIALLCVMVVGCPQLMQNLIGGTEGDVSESALNYDGTLSGCVADTSSTTTSQDTQAAQTVALGSDAVAWLTDLEGNRLLDANGIEYPEFPVDPDGTFDLSSLPVGVDIVLNIDLDGDGEPDLSTIINIPKQADADSGELDGVVVDPLSTATRARLRIALGQQDVDFENLDLSLSGIIGRTRDAYEHLFDDASIDHNLLLNDIRGLVTEELAELFDTQIPIGAQRGMRMAVSNIALAVAGDIEGIVKAAAQTLLEGGFVIADDPDGIDLSFLGELPNVATLTFEQYQELYAMHGPGEPPPARRVPHDFEQAAYPASSEPLLYVSELVEPDRNFTMADEGEEFFMPKPMFTEDMLTRIAELYMDGKTISLRDLHHLLVDAEQGLGARLTYSLWNGPGQPPTDVFESPNGNGVVKNMQALFEELDALFGNPGFDPMAAQARNVRQIILDFLDGTAEPSFERLFGGFLMQRVPSAEEFARYIRTIRAHIPFSRSGPAQWFVVADADPWRNSDAAPITVDIETDSDGEVTKVTLNPGGDGKFYLGHGPMTENGMQTELIRRQNGRMLHSHKGEPQFLDLSDDEVFQAVSGESFFDTFTETGEHWPGAPALRVPNYDFDPTLPPDPETNPPDWEAFVLMTGPGPNAVPVRVSYANGVATNAEAGMYYLLFDEQTNTHGRFALMSETGQLLEAPPGSGWENRVLVAAGAVQGIDLVPEVFTNVYGIEVPNQGYDPAGAPYYDDINNNGQFDAGEPTFAEQHFLWDAEDWRSTWVERYYRRADNGNFPTPDEINWESDTPALRNGVALVPRQFRARLNGYLYGRPNSAINLLMAFSPPEFFDGTRALNEDAPINPLMAVALIDLVFEQTMNVEATVDWDGPGGMPPHEQLVPAWYFITPVDDPVALVAENFANFAE